MNKKLSAIILCGALLFCFAACGNESTDTSDTNTHEATDTQIADTTASTKSTNSIETNTYYQNEEETENTAEQSIHIFYTKNITSISFITKYGHGEEISVPSQYMDEIINWLDSVTIDRMKPEDEFLPPGTNTIIIKIIYSNGTVIENGPDAISIDGICYYTKRDPQPECYYEILDIPMYH